MRGLFIIKIKLKVNPENYEFYKGKLEKLGISIDENASLTLSEDNATQAISAKKENNTYILPVESISFIESFSHNIIIHTVEGQYNKRDTLSYLQNILQDDKFIRVNNSTIVNRDKIKHIRPIIGMRFDLILENNKKASVSRSYYYQFKEKIGF